MASGFIVNTTKPTLTTSYPSPSGSDIVLLAEHRTGTASDARSRALPNASSLSQLDIRLTSWTSSVTLDCFLSWDTAGNDPVTSEILEVSLTESPSSSSIGHVTISLDKLFLAAPTGQTATGKVYLWVKLNSGSNVNLDMARLHWHDKT